MARKKSRNNHFFCRLRMYNGLKAGRYLVKGRKTGYVPFKLICCFKEIESSSKNLENEEAGGGNNATTPGSNRKKSNKRYTLTPQSVCLLITCIPLKSAFKKPNEPGPFKTQFMTKHNSACQLTEIDEKGLGYLGYLPQDIITESNNDIFKFLHPKDLSHIKTLYTNLINEPMKMVRSQPYRFKIYNGNYVTIRSAYSCFINPWTKKLEFVTGKHEVLEGPANPDVFSRK